MKIHELLSHLDGVKQTGQGKWLARCANPGHEDKHPSLAIKLTDDGKILLKCWAGCSVIDILSGTGVSLSDLMPARPDGYDRRPTKAPKFNKFELFDRLVFESMLLSLAIRELLNGKDLSHDDLARIQAAEDIISELAQECRL